MSTTQIRVCAEEVIAPYGNPDNGSGPLWCFGSSTIVRDGDRVFATLPEVGEGLAPLCNTRWQLFGCGADGWERVNVAHQFEEREPCPLVRPAPGRLVLSANRKLDWWGGTEGVRKSYDAQPLLLEFDAGAPGAEPTVHKPVWDGDYTFTEHTYRGIAADAGTGEVLLLNISGHAGHAWSLMGPDGSFAHCGFLGYPERGCYPQVALRGRAAYVIAVSDIVEPNLIWRQHKREHTGRDWDYDFRMLYFTCTPDITSKPFAPLLTFASRDETAGLLRQQDLWIDPEGDAHAVYTDRSVLHRFMRDRFFPDTAITEELKYCRISDSAVVERHTLVRAVEDAEATAKAGPEEVIFDRPAATNARFHSTPDGALYVLYSVNGTDSPATFCRHLLPEMADEPVAVAMEQPLTSFFTASERLGNEPSQTVDLYGTGGEPGIMRYAQLEIV